MKNTSPVEYSAPADFVTPEMKKEAKRLEDDPEAILRLIDLIFLFQDSGETIPS